MPTKNRHVNDSRILGFDVCNECYFSSKDKDGSKALSDLHALIKVIRNIAPNKFTTTGMGNYGLWPGEIEQVPWVDVVSFHSYVNGGVAASPPPHTHTHFSPTLRSHSRKAHMCTEEPICFGSLQICCASSVHDDACVR